MWCLCGITVSFYKWKPVLGPVSISSSHQLKWDWVQSQTQINKSTFCLSFITFVSELFERSLTPLFSWYANGSKCYLNITLLSFFPIIRLLEELKCPEEYCQFWSNYSTLDTILLSETNTVFVYLLLWSCLIEWSWIKFDWVKCLTRYIGIFDD